MSSSSSVATEMGIISVLHTGDPLKDLVVCTAVPMAVERIRDTPHTIASIFESAVESVQDLLAGRRYVYHRVELSEQLGSYGRIYDYYTPHEIKMRKPLLMKALNMYIADHVSLDNISGRYDLVEKKGEPLREVLETEYDSADLSPEDKELLLNSSEEVAGLCVGVLPPLNTWVRLEDGIDFMYSEHEEKASANKGVRQSKKVYMFRTRREDGPAKIREIIEKAFAHYQDVEKRKVTDDTSRYMYVRDIENAPAADEDDGGDETSVSAAPYHKRYALGDDKTFDSLFFDGKESLLQLLEQFETRSGKFAIEGFPYKLSLLLHGPPGTGKTSMIKAIAAHTKRHIVSISLAKIKTNQELMDSMFDLRYKVDGLDLPVKMTFEDVVFVMEDIDCASSVVNARKPVATSSKSKKKQQQKETSSESTDGSADEDNGEAEGNDDEPIDEEVEDAEEPIQLQQQLMPDPLELTVLAALLGGPQTGGNGAGGLLGFRDGFVSSSNSSDKLNLAGLLNVLDGVIDCPGRILIMTTNHPEKLDPALVRPGRVNKKMLLSYMSAEQVQEMLAYYFSTQLNEQQRQRVVKAIGLGDIDSRRLRVTPAHVEEICAECDALDDALAAIERFGADRNHH
ncbi:hypothetical protein PINS_up007074 [Pythium insidiosum]|nr:hypothetical protein PINS_up007074 [Pythium insidiosum]